MIKKGLKPIFDENTKILILGSLPSDESIEKQEYYANKSNDFWKLLGEIFNQNLKDQNYNTKIKFLKEKNIGLWDVFQQSYREGSLDSNIKEEVVNDFSSIKKYCPNIKLICLNGKKSGEHYKIFEELGYEVKVLPSSSGANRRMNRIQHWRILCEYL